MVSISEESNDDKLSTREESEENDANSEYSKFLKRANKNSKSDHLSSKKMYSSLDKHFQDKSKKPKDQKTYKIGSEEFVNKKSERSLNDFLVESKSGFKSESYDRYKSLLNISRRCVDDSNLLILGAGLPKFPSVVKQSHILAAIRLSTGVVAE